MKAHAQLVIEATSLWPWCAAGPGLAALFVAVWPTVLIRRYCLVEVRACPRIEGIESSPPASRGWGSSSSTEGRAETLRLASAVQRSLPPSRGEAQWCWAVVGLDLQETQLCGQARLHLSRTEMGAVKQAYNEAGARPLLQLTWGYTGFLPVLR